MIKELNIHNFQSHKNSSLEFADGVNVIVGASDSGKTAIIRALRWLIWNRPGGDAFRSTWGGETQVEVITEKGTDIARVKGKENEYQIGGEIHRAFSTDVPEPIREALNINETNLQQQLDAHFLLTQSPGEVAKYFNQIAHLDQIDSGLKFLNGQIRQLDSKHGFVVEQQTEVNEALREYEYLDEAEVLLTKIEQINDQFEQDKNALHALIGVIQQLETINTEIEQVQELLQFEDQLDSIFKAKEQLKEIIAQSDAIDVLITDIMEILGEINDANYIIEWESQVDIIFSIIADRDKLEEQWSDLDKLISDIEFNADQIVTLQSNITTAEHEFAHNMPDTCPLCDQKITK